jgi:predicted nucleotidyltransferase
MALERNVKSSICREIPMGQTKITIPAATIAAFCRRNHIHSLALFGSVLRDDFRPDSDVDVLIQFNQDAEIGFLALGRIRRELSHLLKRPVDLVLQDGLKPRLRDAVLSSAEILYAA